MPQQRAADDFATIRARMEELRRERQPTPAAAASDAASNPNAPGLRGPCSCGMSLFADECDGCCKALDLTRAIPDD